MNPIVSIILTSYNKPNSVGKAIESVLKQNYPHWELFIMDDNSNEETLKAIQKYIDHPKVHFYSSDIQDSERYKTTRYATLINKAIPKTKGKYLSYLTDDTIYLPNRLKLMVQFLESNKHASIVYSRQLVKVMGQNKKPRNEFVRKTPGVIWQAAGKVDHCSVMHTRAIAEQVYQKYGSYWNNHPKFWMNGDAAFWNRLNSFQPFHPIHKVLDVAWKFPESFQRLYLHVPKVIPNGTLVKGLSNEIYLIDQQKRRRISREMMQRLKYRKEQIVRIPDPFLFKYSEGEPIDNRIFETPEKFPNQRLIKSKNHPPIYFMQKNKRFRLKNQQVFKQFHFNEKEIVVVNQNTLEKIPESGQVIDNIQRGKSIVPDGIVFKSNNEYFLSFENRLHPIEEDIMKRLKLSVQRVVEISPVQLAQYEKGEPFHCENNRLM